MLFLALLSLAAAAFLVLELVTQPARERSGSMRRAARWGRRDEVAKDGARRELQLPPVKERLAQLVLRLNPRTTVDAVTAKLLSAGLARRVSPTTFLASEVMLAGGGLLFGALAGAASGGPVAFMFALAAATGGFIAPDFFVGSRAKKRRERVRADLPDALDLLAVSVEAGLGFDGALAKLTDQIDGPLGEEFSLMLGEMRIGESRQAALKKLAERVDAPELGTFTRSIVQADRFGISLGRILRAQAVDVRLRRQAAAEERAMKAPIKMLFPTVAFIFPAMFLVILGPAFLNLSRVL